MRDTLTVNELKNKCVDLKKNVVHMIYKAQSGHPGGSLSVAEFMTACYWHAMDVDPKNPKWEDRDRFVLSKGHVCPAQYAALAMKGFFPMDVLETLRKEGSILQGHPSSKHCPGIDISTGSLGQGLACVFSALGDGETNEGEIWEACNTANKYKLDNLIVFVDWNNLQLDGTCDEIMPLGDLPGKFKAFGFDVWEINGNDMGEVVKALDEAMAAKNGNPKCIIGKTVKGNGVSFMENQVGWHGVAPNDEQYKQAMDELDGQYVEC